MTNRDKINGLSNAMLADILCRVDSTYNIICKFCIHRGEDCLGKSCFDGIKAWLDAPVKEPKKQPTYNKAEKLSKKLEISVLIMGISVYFPIVLGCLKKEEGV